MVLGLVHGEVHIQIWFIFNAPPKTALTTLVKGAFTRAGVEHIFHIAKTEIALGHFEGRSYKGLITLYSFP